MQNNTEESDYGIEINKKKKTCKIKGKTFKIKDVERVLDLLELVYKDKLINGYVFKDENLAWALWGIGVLKPYKTEKKIFEPLHIRWKVGPNFLDIYSYFKNEITCLATQSLQPSEGVHQESCLVDCAPA